MVQGVGFRPFVYALARRLALSGTVVNGSAGVTIEVEGGAEALAAFQERLSDEAPRLAQIDLHQHGGHPAARRHRVRDRGLGRRRRTDPGLTRHRHLRRLPGRALRPGRPALPASRSSAAPTADRASPSSPACPTTGRRPPWPASALPGLRDGVRRPRRSALPRPDRGLPGLRSDAHAGPSRGSPTSSVTRPCARPADCWRRGDRGGRRDSAATTWPATPTDATAVSTLRKRKDRGDKPFAIMVADLGVAAEFALVSDDRAPVADRPAAPGGAAARRPRPALPLAPEVAPDSPDLRGDAALHPVHRLLFGLPGDPPGPRVLVLTSGNLAGEPIVTDDRRRAGAPGRPGRRLAAATTGRIHVPCDDSVLRVVDHDQLPVRRSRGYAPLPIALPVPVPPGAGRRRRPEEHLRGRRRAATPGSAGTSVTWTTWPR